MEEVEMWRHCCCSNATHLNKVNGVKCDILYKVYHQFLTQCEERFPNRSVFWDGIINCVYVCSQVERGGYPGLLDELLHRANLLLQHHPRQPLPRRPPLQGHVPAYSRYRRPAPAVHPQQASPQRSVFATVWSRVEIRIWIANHSEYDCVFLVINSILLNILWL